MLVASCLFKEDGTLLESQIPNIVLGDKESVKLEVSFYEDYDNLKFLDLSNYVVEAIFERPDGKVSPALLLGIDLNNFNKKYLIFGGWLTEVAGISKITVRIKQSGTVKATGFLTFTIQDGNVPADVVITEPQFEALENAIQAEEAARKNADSQLQANIDKEIQDRTQAIKEERERSLNEIKNEEIEREYYDSFLSSRIDQHEEEVRLLEQEQNNKFNVVDQILNTKLNKVFTDVPITSDLALTNYFVINANDTPYRITLEQLRDIISQKTDYYKGQFSSLEDLNKRIPSGEGGDYAYVDTPFEDENGNITYQFVMYVWDVEESRWEQTASSQYLGVTTFQAFQESLLNGTFNVGAIEGNVDLIGGEPVLRSLKINDKVYEFPNVSLELSDEPVKEGYNLGSIKIDDNVWNIPHDMLKIKVSSEKIEGATSLGSIKFGEDAYNVGGGSGKLTTIAEFTSVDADNNMILFDNLQFETDTLYFAIIENYVVPIYWDSVSDSINADFSANFADTLYFMHLFYDGTKAPNSLKLTGQALDGSTFPYISHLSSAKICKL